MTAPSIAQGSVLLDQAFHTSKKAEAMNMTPTCITNNIEETLLLRCPHTSDICLKPTSDPYPYRADV